MDLRTNYMGLSLKNPLVASASPLSDSVEKIKRMEDAGASAAAKMRGGIVRGALPRVLDEPC